jgi:hypothetical protein
MAGFRRAAERGEAMSRLYRGTTIIDLENIVDGFVPIHSDQDTLREAGISVGELLDNSHCNDCGSTPCICDWLCDESRERSWEKFDA